MGFNGKRTSALFHKTVSVIVCLALTTTFVPAAVLTHPQKAEAAAAASGKPALTLTRANTGKLTMKKGSSYKLKASATKGSKVTYKSSKSKAVSVSKKGVLKARGKGKATITVKAKKSGKTVIKKVKVTVVAKKKYKKVKKLNVSVSSKALVVGKTTKVKVSFKPTKASNKNVIFKSSNSSVLSVDTSGKVTAKKAGAVKVTVTSCENSKKKARVAFVVKAAGTTDSDAKLKEDVVSYDEVGIDENHHSTVTYASGVVDIAGVDYAIGDDGSVSISAEQVGNCVSVGDVVALEPTDSNPSGKALKVTSVSEADGTATLSGETPSISELYSSIDVEGATEDDYTFEAAEDVEAVEEGEETEEETQSNDGSLSALSMSALAEGSGSASLKKLTLKKTVTLGKGTTVSLETSMHPKVSYRVNYSTIGGLKEAYVGIDPRVATTLKVPSDLAKEATGQSGHIKLGEVKVPTEVPGIEVGVTLYATLTVNAEATVTASIKGEAGYFYRNGKHKAVCETKASLGDVSFKGEVESGFDADFGIYLALVDEPVVDADYALGEKLDASGTVRSTGMVCTDVDTTPYVEISVGKYGLMKKLGLTWSYKANMGKLFPALVGDFHFENTKLVAKCTWKGDSDFSDGGSTGSGETGALISSNIMTFLQPAGASMLLKTNGSLWMWGNNKSGVLGNGTTASTKLPFELMNNVSYISMCSDDYAAAVKTDGTLLMWGNYKKDVLGDEDAECVCVPTKVLSGVKRVYCYEDNVAVVKNDNSLWAWGKNEEGQLGVGTTDNSSVPVKVMDNVKESVVLGAIKTDGTLWTWGKNRYGCLGQGSGIDLSLNPVQILSKVKSVEIYLNRVAAIRNDGSLWTWGNNELNELGTSGADYIYTPTKVLTGCEKFLFASVDDYYFKDGVYSVALKKDGSIWRSGAHGPSDFDSECIMTDVKSMGVWDSSDDCIYAIKNDGTLWCWSYGEETAQVESDIVFSSVLSGGSTMYFVALNGSVYAMKSNGTYGRFGNGTEKYASTPVRAFECVG